MAVNKCEECPRSCCVDFGLTQELTNPAKVREQLSRFPFIKRTNTRLTMGPGGHERVVGVYNCDRYSEKTGRCRDYDTQPRPSFCQNTGEKSVPHSRCLLKKR